MLEKRFEVRRIAEKQKRDLLETVELMKKKGNFDKTTLAKMGIDLDQPKFTDINLDDGS
mgnify:CR=1 FL=1